MLRFLLDEHLSPRIASQFREKCPKAQMESVLVWEGGRLRGLADEALLTEARERGLTLVTYDRATITPLLKAFAEQGVEHAGVVLVDDRTIPPNDIGGLIRALIRLWEAEKQTNWTDLVIYLTRSN
jgi:hypothetical protein